MLPFDWRCVECSRLKCAAQSVQLGKSLDSLGAVVADRNKLLASFAGADVKLVRLASAQSAPPRALMFWNQATNGWTFVAHNLAQLKPGRTYQLWLVTAKEKISDCSVMADSMARDVGVPRRP